jgi:hypothetical protein
LTVLITCKCMAQRAGGLRMGPRGTRVRNYGGCNSHSTFAPRLPRMNLPVARPCSFSARLVRQQHQFAGRRPANTRVTSSPAGARGRRRRRNKAKRRIHLRDRAYAARRATSSRHARTRWPLSSLIATVWPVSAPSCSRAN